MAKKVLKKAPVKKAQNGTMEAPLKSKDRLNVAGGFYEPSRRNQIIDSTFTPKGINQAKLKEHAATLRKMANDRSYLSTEEALRPKPEMKNGGKSKMKAGGKVVAKKVTKVAIKKKK